MAGTANPFDQFDAPAAPVGNPFDQFDAPPPPPAVESAANKALPTLEPIFNMGSWSDPKADRHGDEVLGRAVLKGGATGFFGLPALAIDAGRNAAYGAKTLAAKTGLVEPPDPKNYYGDSDSYIPATVAVSENADQTLDKLGFDKPANAGERMLSAGVEGVTSGIGGVGLGQVVASGGSALARRVGGFLAAQPEIQAAAGAAAGTASQGVMERGPGNERAAALAGLVAGVGTGVAGAKLVQPRRVAVPTLDDLEDAKSAAYQRADAADLRLQPRAVQRLEQGLRTELPNEGIFLQHDPKARGAFAGVERMVMPDAMGNRAPVRLTELDRVRRNVGDLNRSPDPSDRRTGAVFAEHIDDFAGGVTPRDVVSGDIRGIEYLNEARAANRRYAKASALDIALDKGYLRARTSGTGSNTENTQRQNIRRIIQDPNSRAYRQFDEHERAAMRDFVEGSATQNALRWGSRFAPTGFLSGAMSIASIKGGLGIVPLAGLAAKGAGDFLHNRKVRNLEDLVRGGPGAVRRPPAGYRANAARGAAQGFLAPTRAEDEEPPRSRYR